MNKYLTSLLGCISLSIAAMADEANLLKPPGPGAVEFDGANGNIALGGEFPVAGNFTVELWVRPADVGDVRGILGSRNPAEYGFDSKLNRGDVVLNIGSGSGWLSTSSKHLNYAANSWLHLSYVVTQTNFVAYENGRQIFTGNYGASIPILRNADHRLFLGWTGFPNEYFKGAISEIRIWNVARTAKQIANNWHRRLRLPQKGLFAFYPCDETSGTILHDATGNKNNGVFVNGVTWARTDSTQPISAVDAGNLAFHEIRYDGKLADDEARFTLDVDAEAVNKGENSATFIQGDVAILPTKLPDQLKLVREGDRYLLVASHPGRFKFKLDVVAKIQRAEPWNEISFTGPVATISSVTAQAVGAGMEVQLLNGTLLEAMKTNGVSRVKGFLGANPTVALRWQGKITEVARKALLTVDSSITAQLTPSVIKYTSQFHYDIVQGNAAQLTLALPAAQSLTRLVGEQIRDWHTTTDGDRQTLTIEFIKPIEKNYELTIFSEQTVDSANANVSLSPPQPLEIERESGALTLTAEDTLVETESLAGLRQVNAPDKAIAAYRFNARPFTLALKLRHIEPVVSVADRVTARLEETRLVIAHNLSLNVEKAGIYTLELAPQAGFTVADVRGDGVDDWKVSNGKLKINFSARILGQRSLNVQLEQALKNFPDKISVAALRATGASKESAQIGAASAAGIRLKTSAVFGVREIPIASLQNRSDEILAYTTEQPDWNISIASERLLARVVADVFNLVTIGDGLVGGSATIRYGLANQGVQEFKIKVPANCKNIEFTGPNIRRKEFSNDVWTLTLQDKAWGGYTLVVTYDFQFDPKAETLPVGGIHALGVERETGSLAITTAASLQLNPQTVSDTLHRVDETELSAADRSFITRAVVLAYQYTGDDYTLAVDVKRYAEERTLDAVADRTQITSVLTEAGEMLTQASFMVKNSEKQFQGFVLPKNARLWGCYVNGQPAKPERNGEQVLVPLPRDVNRDQAFAVDIMYAETNGPLASTWSKTLRLSAPRTDVPNTYAEWQIYVPPSLRLSSFGGSMNIARGTTYELLDAWEKFLSFYVQVLREMGSAILFFGLLAFFVIAFVIAGARRGWSGLINVLVVMTVLAILAAMLLPALSKAKGRAQRISSANNLKQIGLAARVWSGDNGDRLPISLDEMKNELGGDKVTYDVATGQHFTYIGAGLSLNEITPDSVIAYGPIVEGACNVLMADGSVQMMSARQFGELNQRGLIQRVAPQQVAEQQREAIARGQFQPATRAAGPPAGLFPSGGSGGGGATFGDNLGAMRHGTSEAPMNTSPVDEATGLPVTSTGTTTPTVAGIRSIRIELPQTGQPFLFTKVLNIRDEPLSIRARVMPLRTFQNLQMAWQSAAFVLGLVVWWWQWRMNRNSFILTVALALMLGSVASLLLQWRALHDALIVGFPLVTLAVLAFLIWKFWPRGRKTPPAVERPPMTEPPAPDSGLPPVVAVIVLFLAFSLANARASDSWSMEHETHASIISASYTGAVNDRVAMLDATLKFSGAKNAETIPLFGDDVVVEQFMVKNGKAEIVRSGNSIAVCLGKGSDATLQIKLLVKVAGDVTKRRLSFEIPPALTSEVALALDESEADVDFPAAISMKRIFDKDKTRIAAVLGSSDRVELLWTPRVKRAAEVAATLFCQNSSLVTFGGGVVNVRATLDYQVAQGELRQARVQIPAGQKLLRVEAPGIRTWEIKNENGAQVLIVDLLKGVSPSWKLTVETEKSLDALPLAAAVEVPHALDVKHETGFIGLRVAEELALSVESASGLQRVDAEEFARGGVDASGVMSAFRFSKPEFSLITRVEPVRPQIEAVAKNYFRVSAEQISLSAAVDFTIKRAGVFSLKAALPQGYRVERVNGNNILQQTERVENGSRVLEVTLKDRTIGAYRLGIELTRAVKSLPKSLGIAGVHPLGAEKLTGYIAVSSDAGVAVKTESFDGLTEIPAVSLPDYFSGSVLAYKFISSEPENFREWKLTVATEAIAPWVRAEVVNKITLAETLVSGRSLVRYDIANAPVRELFVRVPEHFRNVDISGPNIRSRERNGNVWRVELQSPTRGFYTLTVAWEQPRASKTNAVEIAGVSAGHVERETGLFAISAKAPLQVSELRASDLQRVDAGDLPDWSGGADAMTALVYRYVRTEHALALEVRRFDEAEVLQVLVDNARLTTVVADDGQMMTEMTLSVRNNGKQFLEIELPRDSKVWSAFVAGEPVRPSLRGEKLLLPIQQSSVDDGAMNVELTYVGTNAFPRKHGPVGLVSPRFDVPLKNARWEVYLPPDYEYEKFSGSMTRAVAAAQTSSSSFSQLEYSRMEKENKEAAKAEVNRDVSDAQKQLAGGNVREANVSLSRAKGKFYSGKDEDAGVKKLEGALKSAQASNLIQAQSDFSIRNSGQSSVGGEHVSGKIPQAIYDSAAAELQLDKLQQAQEIVAAKVQPLRVNLPVRGAYFAFTQVLQTETAKPLTIQMLASSTRAVNWPSRIGAAAVAFGILWGLVAIFSRATRRVET